MSIQFTHLHFHTHYSLLDGAIKVKGLGKYLAEIGYSSCAITDHGNLHGIIEFEKEMKSAGIKPIIGMEAYVAKINRTHRSYPKPGPNAYHTVLLCENKVGYHNLIKPSSIGYSEGKYYGKPRIDHEVLEKHSEGLIVLSACIGGEVARRLLEGQEDEAREVAKWYADLFPGRYYIELQANGLADQEKVNPKLIEIAKDLNLPLIGTCDCHYKTREDAENQHILQLMGWQQKVTDPDAKTMNTDQSYIKTQDEMLQAFSNLPEECLTNTQIIVDRCDLDLSNKKLYLPDYPVEEGKSFEQELVDQAKNGLVSRFDYLRKLYSWSNEEEQEQNEIYKKDSILN